MARSAAFRRCAPTLAPPAAPAPLAGRFARDCCPAYLTPSGFAALKQGALDALHIENGFFLPTLNARRYTKVCVLWVGVGGVGGSGVGCPGLPGKRQPATLCGLPPACIPAFLHSSPPSRFLETAFHLSATPILNQLAALFNLSSTHQQVILMDHLDWLDEKAAKEYAAALARQVGLPAAGRWPHAAKRLWLCSPPCAGRAPRCMQRAALRGAWPACPLGAARDAGPPPLPPPRATGGPRRPRHLALRGL